MSVTTAIARMIALGVPTEDALSIAREIEESVVGSSDRKAASERQARWRAKKAETSTKRLQNRLHVDAPSPPPNAPLDKEKVEPKETNPPLNPPPLPPPLSATVELSLFSEADDDCSAREVVSVDEAFRDWNTAAKACGLRPALALNPSRRAKLKLRLTECGGNEAFRDALRQMGQSPFLLGDNDRGWRADLDFVLQPGSFAKLREGSYARGDPATKLKGAAALAERLRQRIANGTDGRTEQQGSVDPDPRKRLAVVGGTLHR